MVPARLLDPKDFGLVGMVTAFRGVLYLFKDFGLSSATVQRVDVTDEQISTLFWINIDVALGLSAAMALWTIPHIALGVYGTGISVGDILRGLVRPLTSGVVATVLALAINLLVGTALSPLERLVLEGTILFGAYAGILLYIMGQKDFYFELLRGLRRRSVEPSTAAST
jgi:O-antigen/teichoic acid export membrane protein